MPSIDISDAATPALKSVEAAIREEAREAIGAVAVDLFQQNFRKRPSNRQGWPSTGFWAGAVRATNYTVAGPDVNVNVDQQGVRQRLQGGEIHPTGGKKYLTIPARSESYGKSAKEFSNIELAFRRRGGVVEAWALVSRAGGAKRKSFTGGEDRKIGGKADKGGGVLFWLVKSVNQKPDPSVIPSGDEITSACIKTIAGIVNRAMKRAGGGAATNGGNN